MTPAAKWEGWCSSECASSLSFFLWYLHAHSSSLTEVDAQAWNEHEQRELWLAFSHYAGIYRALYVSEQATDTKEKPIGVVGEPQQEELAQAI